MTWNDKVGGWLPTCQTYPWQWGLQITPCFIEHRTSVFWTSLGSPGFICTNAAILVGFLMPLSATYEHKYIWIRLSKKRNVNNYKTNVKMSMAKTQRIPTCTLQTTSPYGSGFTIPFSNLRFHLGTWSNGKSVQFFFLEIEWQLSIAMENHHVSKAHDPFLGHFQHPTAMSAYWRVWILDFIIFHRFSHPKSAQVS